MYGMRTPYIEIGWHLCNGKPLTEYRSCQGTVSRFDGTMRLWNAVRAVLGTLQGEPSAEITVGSLRASVDALIGRTMPLISVPELAAMTKPVTILDARSRSEFAASHLRDAIRVGYVDFHPRKVASLRKDRSVVIYCSIGFRSEKIGEKLRKLGFQDVRNLYGGIFEWYNQGNPVVDDSGAVTKAIHTYGKMWAHWVRSRN